MRQSSDWQEEFASALLRPDLPAPTRLRDPEGEQCPRRFAVYRNNVVHGLMAALRDSFPATLRIVGPEFFDAMARLYVLGHPPRSPVLLEYGSDFAAFVQAFEPAKGVPYLADVCRIERAWLEAYHAPDYERLDPERMSPADVPSSTVQLHPSVRLVRSRFPALTIWSTNIEGELPRAIDLEAGGEAALLFRAASAVEVRGLSPAEAEFVEALSTGCSIRAASWRARETEPGFSMAEALEGLLATGAVVGFCPGGQSFQHAGDQSR